jgi:DNA-binding sugar fermentation-stimulating protein
LQELIKIKKETDFDAEILFLLTNNVEKFAPNSETDPDFAKLFYEFLKI